MFITTKLRRRSATLALAATVFLTVLKLGGAMVSDSVGVLSDGVHSFLDLLSAAVACFSIRAAGKPADEDHPFGHGKIETLSSLFEALLLVLAAILIFFEGLEHFLNPHPIRYPWLAVFIMAISAAVSWVVYVHNRSAAFETESTAIETNAVHFLSDVVSSMAILFGLAILKITGILIIDALMAFSVALYVIMIAAKQVRHALFDLTDKQLPENEIAAIRETLKEFEDRVIEWHDLRSRKSGATRHIDFHLVVCGHVSVHNSHAICDEIEARILERFPSSSVNIHVEPCAVQKTNCEQSCLHYSNLKESLKK